MANDRLHRDNRDSILAGVQCPAPGAVFDTCIPAVVLSGEVSG